MTESGDAMQPMETGICERCRGSGRVECDCVGSNVWGAAQPSCAGCGGTGAAPCPSCRASTEPPHDDRAELEAFLPPDARPDSAARIAGLLEALSKGSGGVRHLARAALCALPTIAVVPFLTSGLRSRDGVLRPWCARVLGELGPIAHDALPALVSACVRARVSGSGEPRGTDSLERETARALRRVDPDERDTAREAAAALRDPAPLVRAAALGLLRNIDTDRWPPDGLALVERVVRDPEPWVRRKAIEVLSRNAAASRGPAGVRGLTLALDDDDPKTLLAAVAALDAAGLDALPAVPALIRVMLRTGLDRRDFEESLEDPWRSGDRRARSMFRTDHPDFLAAGVVAKLDPTAGVAAARAALADPDEAVRYRASRALQEIQGGVEP